MKTKLLHFYNIYSKYFPIIAPVLLLDSLILFQLDSIPYVNLYARYIILFVLFANWFVISKVNRFTFLTSLKSALFLFLVCGVLMLVNAGFYAELIADIIFIILFYSIIKEFYFLYAKKN